jgi:hypothetical protein
MKYKLWNPKGEDGRVADGALEVPLRTLEPTTWIITDDQLALVQGLLLMFPMRKHLFVLPPTADKYLTKHPANVTFWEE